MSRYIFSALFALVFFSFTAVAQDNAIQNVTMKGKVVRVDTNANNQNNADGTQVVFRSNDGTLYYLLPARDKQDIFEKIKKHPEEPIEISGRLSDKGEIKSVTVESFFFL